MPSVGIDSQLTRLRVLMRLAIHAAAGGGAVELAARLVVAKCAQRGVAGTV